MPPDPSIQPVDAALVVSAEQTPFAARKIVPRVPRAAAYRTPLGRRTHRVFLHYDEIAARPIRVCRPCGRAPSTPSAHRGSESQAHCGGDTLTSVMNGVPKGSDHDSGAIQEEVL